jgi:lysozyme family protein
MDQPKLERVERFMRIISHTLNNEGGYVNNPNDSGGETNFGISKRSYPHLDIKNLSKLEAIGIYKKDFWDKYKIEKIKDFDVAQKIFDMCVNLGPKQAIKLLQRAHGGLHIDGIMGTITFGEINQCKPQIILGKFKSELEGYYRELVKRNPKNAIFLNGWLKRAAQ